MHYLALGDSISIDDYTGVLGGGAASQFAKLIDAKGFDSWARDGCTTQGVLTALESWHQPPNVVTLTACGNDLLVGLASEQDSEQMVSEIIERFDKIISHLKGLNCPVIVNTIYDPTDGEDDLAVMLGLPNPVRKPFDQINNHIRGVKGDRIIVSDLEALFAGRGNWSADPWIVGYIEPNLAGATAIANHWFELFRAA
jgi:lysophospholipase L1-like esterase